jgi:hypothetical protein
MLYTNFKLRNSWRQQDGNQNLLIEGKTINTITNNNKKKERKHKGANMTHTSRNKQCISKLWWNNHEHKYKLDMKSSASDGVAVTLTSVSMSY